MPYDCSAYMRLRRRIGDVFVRASKGLEAEGARSLLQIQLSQRHDDLRTV